MENSENLQNSENLEIRLLKKILNEENLNISKNSDFSILQSKSQINDLNEIIYKNAEKFYFCDVSNVKNFVENLAKARECFEKSIEECFFNEKSIEECFVDETKNTEYFPDLPPINDLFFKTHDSEWIFYLIKYFNIDRSFLLWLFRYSLYRYDHLDSFKYLILEDILKKYVKMDTEDNNNSHNNSIDNNSFNICEDNVFVLVNKIWEEVFCDKTIQDFSSAESLLKTSVNITGDFLINRILKNDKIFLKMSKIFLNIKNE